MAIGSGRKLPAETGGQGAAKADEGPPLRFHVPNRQEVDQFFQRWPGARVKDGCPSPEERVDSPATPATTLATGASNEDLSASAPSTVGWPEAMGISREHDSSLSLNESISPAVFSRASTASTLPWIPSPADSNPPAKKAKSIPPCPPATPSQSRSYLKRELFPAGEKPRPTTKAHLAKPVPPIPAKEEWTPPDPSTRRVPELCPSVRPTTPLRCASPKAKHVPTFTSPPPPAAAKTHARAAPSQAKQPEPKPPQPCLAKAAAPASPPPPPQKTEGGTPAPSAAHAQAHAVVPPPAPVVKALAPPPAHLPKANEAAAKSASALVPPKQPPAAAKATVASPPSLENLLAFENKMLDDLEKNSDEEIEVKITEARNHAQFKAYMKHMMKEFSLEEKDWCTYEPREELVGFYVWLEEYKAVLTPSNVATPQNNHAVPAIPAPTPPPPAPVAKKQAFTPVPAAPPKATAAKASSPQPKTPASAACAPAKAVALAAPNDSPAATPHGADRVHVESTEKAIVPEDYNERQALQGEFKRRMKNPEANCIPDDFVTLWQDAVRSNAKATKTALFEKWLTAGKDWSMLRVDCFRSHTDRTTSRKKMGWKTRAQLIQIHGGDAAAADRIIAKKESEGAVQDHHDDDELKTYYVCIEIGKKEEEEVADHFKYGSSANINNGGEAALKLMAGMDHSQALRPSGRLERPAGYRKPTPAVDVGNGRVPRAKCKAGTRRPGNGEDRKKDKEMPDHNEMPIAATHWLVDQLLKDLQTAKVLPIKMANMKHQDGLRTSLLRHATDLESSYFQLKAVADQIPKDAETHAIPDLGTWLDRAVTLRAAYLESAAMATQLCKPKGGRKKKADDEQPDA